MTDVYAPPAAEPRAADREAFRHDTPRWLIRAMELFADHNLPNDEFDLRGQYAENRMFLRRIEQDRQKGMVPVEDQRELEEAFAKSCADPHGDPMLALESVYLQQYYRRQPVMRRAQAPAPA